MTASPLILPDAKALLDAAMVRAVLADVPEHAVDLASVDPAALLAFARAINPAHRQRAVYAVRDRAIAALAEQGRSPAAIASDMAAYASNGWIRDRQSDICPARYAGRPAMLLWLCFKCHPQPLSKRRIEQVIEFIGEGAKSDPPSDFAASR